MIKGSEKIKLAFDVDGQEMPYDSEYKLNESYNHFTAFNAPACCEKSGFLYYCLTYVNQRACSNYRDFFKPSVKIESEKDRLLEIWPHYNDFLEPIYSNPHRFKIIDNKSGLIVPLRVYFKPSEIEFGWRKICNEFTQGYQDFFFKSFAIINPFTILASQNHMLNPSGNLYGNYALYKNNVIPWGDFYFYVTEIPDLDDEDMLDIDKYSYYYNRINNVTSYYPANLNGGIVKKFSEIELKETSSYFLRLGIGISARFENSDNELSCVCDNLKNIFNLFGGN